jgi:type IV pilus assembly protein PilB
VRFRIDGVVSESTTVPRRMVPGVISRIKIMSDLDIAESRRPQDGRMGLMVEGRQVDIRVVTLPIVHGESVVMRILDKSNVVLSLDALGMSEWDAARFHKAIGQAHGAVLVTGPTGSGKTTTLYAALGALNTPDKTLITIEDPVEYKLGGIKQIQVNNKVGLSFAMGLRSMLRSDPNVIMVGEIRDRETAQIAVESALTGHLVLSTLHTNDAPSAVTRLVEMGIEPFLVGSSLDCVLAQRLVRRLCEWCKRPYPPSHTELAGARWPEDPLGVPDTLWQAVGCRACAQTGYRGRIALHEVLPGSEQIERLAVDRASAHDIQRTAISEGMTVLRFDGLQKAVDGQTSLAEVLRVAV